MAVGGGHRACDGRGANRSVPDWPGRPGITLHPILTFQVRAARWLPAGLARGVPAMCRGLRHGEPGRGLALRARDVTRRPQGDPAWLLWPAVLPRRYAPEVMGV